MDKLRMERLLAEADSAEPEIKYSALGELTTDAWNKIQGLNKVLNHYRRESRKLQDEALAKYKEKLLLDFYAKHEAEFESGKFTSQTMKAIEVMDRIDKNGCYHFIGLQVQKADCNTCPRKNTCWGAEK